MMKEKLLRMCLMGMMLLAGTSVWALSQVDGVYQIGTGDDLKAFAELVNSGEVDANAVLTADIEYDIKSPQIGNRTNDYTSYNGTFDGQGHSVTINMFAETEGCALFNGVGPKGWVKNLIVKGTITTSSKLAAGVAVDNFGLISNCVADITIVSSISGDATHGGIAARGLQGFVVDCLSMVKMQSKTATNCGGLVGWPTKKMSVENCLNINEMELAQESGSAVVVRNPGGNLGRAYGVYFKTPFGDLTGGTQITDEDLKSGKVCFLLNNDQSDIQWTQNIGEDDYPVPFKTHKQVYCSADTKCDGTTDVEGATYSNTPAGGTPTPHELTAGFCSVCKGVDKTTTYHATSHNDALRGYFNMRYLERDKDGYYLIKNADDMLWLSNMIPMGLERFHARFVNDVDFSEHGYWINTSNWFAGKIDGAGHKVTLNIDGADNYPALVPQLAGDVSNIWIDGTLSTSRTFAGSVCCEFQKQDQRGAPTITNVISTAEIITTKQGDGTQGGLVGRATVGNGKITNCMFAGAITSPDKVTNNCGGLIGWASNPVFVDNCVVAATFDIGDGDNNTFSRNSTNLRVTERPLYYLNANGAIPAGTIQIFEEDLASGALAYLLNGDQSKIEWTQALGTDDYPMPFPGHGQVYAQPSDGYRCDGTPLGTITYTNTPQSVIIPAHTYADGFCAVCDQYDPDYMTPNEDGFYVLSTPRQLAWFSHKVVDGGNGSLNAIMTEDLDMSDETHFRSIGIEKIPYNGHFDGQHHVISNLIINEPAIKGVGFIGAIAGPALIENLTLDESCAITGNGYVGFIGFSAPISGSATLRNLGNEGSVTSVDGANAGGILGCSMSSSVKFTLENCYSTGAIKGPKENGMLSGWLGSNAVVTNCWSTSEIEGFSDEATKFCRRGSATFTNCYATDGDGSQAAKVTAEQVESGYLTYKLNGSKFKDAVWFQTLGEDLHPVTIPTHAVPYYIGGEYGSVKDGEIEDLFEAIKTVEKAYLYDNNDPAFAENGKELIAEDSLIQAYDAAIDALEEIDSLNAMWDAYQELLESKKPLTASANAYIKYINRAAEIRDRLKTDDSFEGDDRDFLDGYINGADPASAEGYPNGAYYTVVDDHILSAEQLAAEIEYMENLLKIAVARGGQPGTEVTDLLVNAKFKEDFKTGWEGKMATGRESHTLKSPVDGTQASWIGAECWNNTFDMHQTVTGLKQGLYLLQMNAAQRPSSSIDTQSLNYTASLYANENSTYINAAVESMISQAEAIDGVNANITGATADYVVVDEMTLDTFYMAHGLLSMAIIANADRSLNYIVAKVGEDGKLTVGIKSPGSTSGSDWTGFANTKVFYLGDMDGAVATEGIDKALAGQVARATKILQDYIPSAGPDYATYPNFSAALKEALETAIGEAESAASNEDKYAVIQKFSELFENIYACKQAYLSMFRDANLVEDVAIMMQNELSEADLKTYLGISDDLRVAYEDGLYSAEEAAAPAIMAPVEKFIPETDPEDGFMKITDKTQMAYFAAYANQVNGAQNAKMMNDIDMTGIEFIGVGTEERHYTGTFDGQCHTFSNVFVSGGAYAGVFGCVGGGATIKRFIVDENSYIYGDHFVGIVGGSSGSGTITLDQLGNEGIVEGANQNVAGIIGCNNGSAATFVITNCYTTGPITGGRESAAITGWTGGSQSSITNCWSTSAVVGMDGGKPFYRNDDTVISNCFNLTGEQATKLDSLETVNGALTWKLNGSSVDAEPVWYQKIGTDAYPRLFTGDVVYYYGGEYMNEKPVVELNSYAYALESASDAEKATISYALMSPAKAAKINFYAGGTKVHSEELAGDDLTMGTHSVEVLNKNLGEVGTEITFDVEVTSIGVKEARRVNSPTEGGRYLANAVRSMAFNDNTESTAFGTIYVVEPKTSRDELTGTQKTGGISDDKLQGLFAFTPTFEPILAEDGTPGFKGGLTYEGGVKVYDDNAQYDPKTVSVSDDGRVFVSRMSGRCNSPIYEVNPENLNEPWTPVFAGGELDSTSGITYVGDDIQSGQVAAFSTSGSGENLKLWAIMAGRTDGKVNYSDFFAYVYDLGTTLPYTGVPTQKIDSLWGQWSVAASGLNIATDHRGGVWFCSFRSSPKATEPSLVHINAEGKVDYFDKTKSMPGGGLAVSRDGSILVQPYGNKTVVVNSVNYAPMANGMIALTPLASIPTNENYASGLTMDYAGNIYVASYNKTPERSMNRYVWPSDEEVVTTTPSSKRAAFKVGETKTGIEKVNMAGENEIYNLGGVRMEKAQKGVNIVNGKKVLVK